MILVTETMMALGLLCTATKRSHDSEGFVYGTDSAVCFEIGTGLSAEDQMANELEEMVGVREVRFHRQRGRFSIDVYLSSFDKATRRSIYAKERDFYSRFQHLDSVNLIDVSENVPDANAE